MPIGSVLNCGGERMLDLSSGFLQAGVGDLWMLELLFGYAQCVVGGHHMHGMRPGRISRKHGSGVVRELSDRVVLE